MRTSTPLADARLVNLLQELLKDEVLPPLDRWFSSWAKAHRWSISDQKALWTSLRVAFTRVWSLVPSATTPLDTTWSSVRGVLKTRATEWATRSVIDPSGPLDLRTAGIPPWLRESWQARVRLSLWTMEEQQSFLGAQSRESPTYLRFHPGLDAKEWRERMLLAGDIGPSDVEGIDRLVGSRSLPGSEAWNRGLVEIQDASSQLSLRHLGLRPGHRVWDVCAGEGGKTLLAASELRGKGVLVATDVSANKVRVLKDRARRSGWQNLRCLSWDGETWPNWGPEIQNPGSFDRVIVDAPCSASGTWRRDPDGRFRISVRGIQELNRHQARLIRLGWSALKPGGRLAYVTCSWLPEENERIVEGFCEESGAEVWHQELLGLPQFDANTLFVAVLGKGS